MASSGCGRLRLLSACDSNDRRATEAIAARRNELVVAVADSLLIIHAAPGLRIPSSRKTWLETRRWSLHAVRHWYVSESIRHNGLRWLEESASVGVLVERAVERCCLASGRNLDTAWLGGHQC